MFWANMILGLALMAAPFALGYSTNPAALWGSLVVGAVIAIASGYKAYTKTAELWEDWVDIVAGVIAIVLPFLFGFNTLAVAMWTSIVLGIIVVAIAAYDLYAHRSVARQP
ncbi:MAG: SPW repeat protein [Chloroflexales bacterium]|nr:SPW repeat protein [Chloroflexales bacterium]